MAMSVVYSNAFGGIIAENRGGVISDYVQDPLGSTIGLMDSTGTLTDRWEYWPWGEVVSRTGTNPTPFTFLGVIGYFKDVLDKLFYVRARHLRVELARWLTVDPLWPNRVAYSYCSDSPHLHTDPSGLDEQSRLCLIAFGCVKGFIPCQYPCGKGCLKVGTGRSTICCFDFDGDGVFHWVRISTVLCVCVFEFGQTTEFEVADGGVSLLPGERVCIGHNPVTMGDI